MSDNDDTFTLRYVHCEILIKGLHDKYYCDTSLANYILTTENSKIFIFAPPLIPSDLLEVMYMMYVLY